MSGPLSRGVVYWGWLRLLVGTLQMACSVYPAYLVFEIGLQPVTWVFIAAAFAATGLCRLLYRGRPDPQLGKEDRHLTYPR